MAELWTFEWYENKKWNRSVTLGKTYDQAGYKAERFRKLHEAVNGQKFRTRVVRAYK